MGKVNETKKEEIVENFKRSPYDFAGRLADYTTLFILFGYLVMFSPALPIAAVGVVSNSGLIVFTMGMFSAYTFQTQMWIFIGMQWLMFTLLAAGGSLIKDDPYRVEVQRKRTDYYNSTLPPLYDKGGFIQKLVGGKS